MSIMTSRKAGIAITQGAILFFCPTRTMRCTNYNPIFTGRRGPKVAAPYQIFTLIEPYSWILAQNTELPEVSELIRLEG